MAKIIIDNVLFDYNIGCRVLKLKYKECPFSQMLDIWNDIIPMTFKDIAESINNLEQRRIAIMHLGLDRLQEQVNPKLIAKETIRKSTTWITAEGTIETKEYDDTYELYEVDGRKLSGQTESWRRISDVHYVKCKDTSTDREYFIWVDRDSICRANSGVIASAFNPIAAIAWTFTTVVPIGSIEKIIRQGDCIMIKHKEGTKLLETERHLTEKEYRELLEEES